MKDADGGVVPGATVTATNAATSLVRTTTTGAEGRYVLAGLPPGEYELRVEISGIQAARTARPHRCGVADAIVVNAQLEIGGASRP